MNRTIIKVAATFVVVVGLIQLVLGTLFAVHESRFAFDGVDVVGHVVDVENYVGHLRNRSGQSVPMLRWTIRYEYADQQGTSHTGQEIVQEYGWRRGDEILVEHLQGCPATSRLARQSKLGARVDSAALIVGGILTVLGGRAWLLRNRHEQELENSDDDNPDLPVVDDDDAP